MVYAGGGSLHSMRTIPICFSSLFLFFIFYFYFFCSVVTRFRTDVFFSLVFREKHKIDPKKNHKNFVSLEKHGNKHGLFIRRLFFTSSFGGVWSDRFFAHKSIVTTTFAEQRFSVWIHFHMYDFIFISEKLCCLLFAMAKWFFVQMGCLRWELWTLWIEHAGHGSNGTETNFGNFQ